MSWTTIIPILVLHYLKILCKITQTGKIKNKVILLNSGVICFNSKITIRCQRQFTIKSINSTPLIVCLVFIRVFLIDIRVILIMRTPKYWFLYIVDKKCILL
jgi:hypothetical protein